VQCAVPSSKRIVNHHVVVQFTTSLLLLAAILGILNHRYLRLPRTIALMAGSLILSVMIILIDRSVSSVELTRRRLATPRRGRPHMADARPTCREIVRP
jgi:hypothetical protein